MSLWCKEKKNIVQTYFSASLLLFETRVRLVETTASVLLRVQQTSCLFIFIFVSSLFVCYSRYVFCG